MRKAYINTVIFIGNFVLGILLVGNATLYSTVSGYFGVDDVSAWIGFFSCAFYAGVVTTAVVSGEMAERLGKKNVAGIFSFVSACGTLLVALCSTPQQALAAYVIVGFGFGAVQGVLGGIAVDESEKSSAHIMNLSTAFCSAGAVISPLVINNYLLSGGSWQNIYMITAVFFSVTGILFFMMKTTSKKTVIKTKSPVSFSVFKNKFFILACIMIFMYVGFEAGASIWATDLFSGTTGSYSLSVLFAACGISRLIFSRIASEKSLYIMLFVCLSISAAGFLGVILFSSISTSVCIIFYAVMGFGFGPLWPTFFAFGTDAAGQLTGAGSGMIMMCESLGGVVISPLLGMLSGINILWGGFAIVLMVIVIQTVYTVLKKREI